MSALIDRGDGDTHRDQRRTVFRIRRSPRVTRLSGPVEAQARLIAAYEEKKWPRRPLSAADLIRHLMDQHGLTRADLIPLLGASSRVSEVLRGKTG